jgi:putative salt-induced outer membrane protein YdiY
MVPVAMKTTFKDRIRYTLAALALFATGAQAATLSLTDGSMIKGSLEKVHDGVYHFKTGFAGVLEIPQAQVAALDSEDAIAVRTETGEVFQGSIVTGPDGKMTVASSGGAVRTGLSSVKSAWQPGARDPIQVAHEAELAGKMRKWSYTAGVDISGSDGNSENFGSALHFEAKLEGPEDRLLMYASYKYKETDGLRSEDEQKGGIKYTNFFSGKWGWFVREEIERDSFEGIDFRSTTAAGITRRFITEDRMTLEGSAGISYRFEAYSDDALTDEGFPGLDLALDYNWQFADWGKLVTHVSFVPSIDDLGDFLIEHESGIDVPLGTSDAWVLRFGLSNQYNSSPSAGREKLDTSYFTRLILNWK